MHSLTTARKAWSLLNAAERREIFVLLALMLTGTLLEVLGIGLVIPAIALLTGSGSVLGASLAQRLQALLGNPSRDRVIVAGMLLLAAVYLVKNVTLALIGWRQARFANRLEADLANRLFRHYLSQPYTFHLQRNSATLINHIGEEVFHFAKDLVGASLVLTTEILVLAGLTVLAAMVDPLGILILGGSGLIAAGGFQHVMRKHVIPLAEARQYHGSQLMKGLQEGLGAAKDVILLGRQTEFLHRFGWHKSKSAKATEVYFTLQQLPRLTLELLAILGFVGLTVLTLAQGHPASDVLPALGLFAAAGFRVIPSTNRVLTAIQTIQYARPSLDVLYTDLIEQTEPNPASARGPVLSCDSIALRRVTYTYPTASARALDDVSLVVNGGESVGIIGASGAGKSTLVDVLLGLLLPGEGRVEVDGWDIRENARAWQDKIGYVPQSIFLSDDTIRRNIAFGLADEEIDEKAILRVIRAPQLEEFVARLPQGLDTVVGERGVRLSGGERQRIGIARALYHDPPVLVLDEATSSLDVKTEREVMKSVYDLHNMKTIVIVAHRSSAVENCDRIYRISRGRVVGEGTPTMFLAPMEARSD